ncbi:hypothetical protein BDV12DRAFT_189999 [Aspergillus spectabilis]
MRPFGSGGPTYYKGFLSALEQHQRLLVYYPLSNLDSSALLHHLESGTRCTGMNRGELMVYNPYPTNSNLHLGRYSRYMLRLEHRGSVYLYPKQHSICYSLCLATFKSLQSLSQHQQSATHTSARFTCPITLLSKKPAFMRPFTTISGLVQCLEAGACAGGYIMLQEARYFEPYLQNMGFKRKIFLNNAK